jgi:hypothetical protein
MTINDPQSALEAFPASRPATPSRDPQTPLMPLSTIEYAVGSEL